MIRMSGVVSLKVESIPWVRVTDTSFTQDFLERLIGTYTVNIESANETAGLRRMRGIAQHEDFERHMTDMIVAKQGATVPLGRRSDYSVMPPDRSYRGFRGRERDRRKGKGFREGSAFEHEGAEGATATKVEDETDVGDVAGDDPTVEAPIPMPPVGPRRRPRPPSRRRGGGPTRSRPTRRCPTTSPTWSACPTSRWRPTASGRTGCSGATCRPTRRPVGPGRGPSGRLTFPDYPR